ncbi:MAG: alkaline phosphatase [Elusimicrobia bacterium]|nr:alkaline phosphatase [Elusimicrobiota bacterium]
MSTRWMLLTILLLSGGPPPLLAKNVILFIGDGMGPAVLTATRLYHKGAAGSLILDSLPYVAITKTYSADNRVTDSAAGATAIATGQKTKNNALSQDVTSIPGKKNGKNLKTIAEIAREMGKAVGIVTTTRITHATPAAFYAHVHHREQENEIARQLLESAFDLFLGGGLKKFNSEALQANKKFTVVYTRQELFQKGLRTERPLLGLFQPDHLTYMADRDVSHRSQPTLSDLTSFALQKLSQNEKGYFLMVEGGRIDLAEHENLARHAISETLELDHAVRTAIRLARLKETLLLVTADHETGGLAINGYPSHDEDLLPYLSFATGPQSPVKKEFADHTGVDIHTYAIGKGARRIHGTLDNTELFEIMWKVLKDQ